MSPAEALIEAGWKPRELPGFIHTAGPLWIRREDEGWAYGIATTPAHANPAGLVHGGVLTTLLDHTISTVAWEAAGRKPCVTVQLDTHFLAAAAPGDFIEVRAQVLRTTASLVFLQGQLTSGSGGGIAVATAVMKILERAG